MDIVDQYRTALKDMGVFNWDSEENGEKLFLKNYLSAFTSPVVFDVGANRGGYLKLVKEVCNSALVYAFEPHPATYAVLETETKGLGITTFNCGLGKTDEKSLLFDYQGEDGSSHASIFREVIETIHQSDSVSHPVRLRKLDDVVKELEIKQIDLLKIDTEGNELDVLIGAEQSIRSGMINVIHFEFNDMNVISRTFFKDFFDFLPEYDFYRLMPAGAIHIRTYIPWLCEIFAYQNIVCTRKR